MFRVSAFRIVILLCVCVWVSCKKDEEGFAPFEAGQLGALSTEEKAPALAAEKLEVLAATPKGEVSSISEAQTIAVVFNQPIVEVSEETQAEKSTGPLKFEPEVKGKYRWLGSRTLIFSASDTLALATTFKVTVPKGLKALSGKELQEDYTFEFTTLRVGIKRIEPTYRVRLDNEIMIGFNQPVTPDVAKKMTLRTESGSEVKFTVRQLSKDDMQKIQSYRESGQYGPSYMLRDFRSNELLWLKPAALQPGEKYVIEFEKSAAEKQAFRFSTFEKFEFRGKDEQNILPSEPVTIEFSNPVQRKELLKHLSFSEKVDSMYLRDDDYANSYHELYFGFKPAMGQTLTISKELTDEFGNKLGKDVRIKVKVGDYPESIKIPTGYLVIESDLPFLDVRAMNKDRAEIELAKMSEEEVMKINPYAYYDEEDKSMSKVPAGLRSFPISFQNRKNRLSVEPIDLRSMLQGSTSGFVFAQIKGPYYDSYTKTTQYRYQRALIQVTPFAVTAKHSASGSLVMVTRLKDASPVAGATVKAYLQNGSFAWSGTTNAQGVAQLPELKETPYYIFAEQDGSVAYTTLSFSEGIEPYRFNLFSSDYEAYSEEVGGNAYVTRTGSIFTERGLYRAGETVYFKGTLREYRNSKWIMPKQRSYHLLIKNSRDETILMRRVTLSSDFGSFADGHEILFCWA